MRRTQIETLEIRRLLANILPAFADQIGLDDLIDPNTTYEDNFDGTTLDRNKWQVRQGPRWRKVPNGPISEMSVTGEDSIVVRNGNLELIAFTDSSTGQNRSGYIQTGRAFRDNRPSDIAAAGLASGYNGNFEQAYGFWEARLKFSSLPGQWNAFWVHSYGMVDVNNDTSRINHPEIYGTEYDVAEQAAVRQGSSVQNQVSTALHANGYKNYQRSTAVHTTTSYRGPSYTSPDQFHVYGLLWTPTYAKFFIDGNVVHTETDPVMVSKVPHVAILSNEIGAGGALFPNDGSNYFGQVPAAGYGSRDTSQAKLTADYIRVWKLKGTPTPSSRGSVAGIVFNDSNGNGARDSGEAGLANRTVYVDGNWNSVFDTNERRGVTSASGEYLIEDVSTGIYPVRQILTSGTQTTSASASLISFSPGQRASLNLGVGGLSAAPAVVEGRVIRDANTNGVFDTGEPGVAGIKVYIDLNNNSVRDDNETQVVTNSSGGYRIESARVGNLVIRLNLAPTDWIQTLPGYNGGQWLTLANGQATNAPAFGVRPRVEPVSAVAEGRVIKDANRNGVIDDGEAGAGNINVYLDYNNNNRRDDEELQATTNANGTYRLVSTRAGSLAARLNLNPTQWVQTVPNNAGGQWISLTNGAAVAVSPFAVRTVAVEPTLPVITGTVFNDANRNGRRDTGENGRANVVVFIDRNMNGRPDNGEPTRTSGSDGSYRFDQVALGNAPVSVVIPTNFAQSAPSGGTYWVWAVAGQTYAERNFGLYENVVGARIAGSIYLDANRNGSRQDGEAGVAGIRVYVDANTNGRWDDGEMSVLTSSSGTYAFERVPAGNTAVRVALTSEFQQITPGNNGSNWLTTANGGRYDARNFGVSRVAQSAGVNTIRGRVIADWNANGRLDAGEGGIGYFKVYLDYNGNGRQDAGEPVQQSDVLGSYRFDNVRAGNLAIRLDLTGRSSYIQSYPASNGGYWLSYTGGSISERNFFVHL
jgi:beta-glucanase (GH16 family)